MNAPQTLVLHEEPGSQRRAVADLASPRPLLGLLPSIYHEDDIARRWLDGLDTVIAPVLAVLDCFAAYLDPDLAPADFVEWLGSWVGVERDPDVDLATHRRLVQAAVGLFGMRGTAEGIRSFLELSLPVRCEVVEGGAAAASTVPAVALPGTAAGAFIVRLTPLVSEFDEARRRRAILLVESMRPAHLPVVVEFADAEPDGGATTPASTQGRNTEEDEAGT